MEGETHDEDVCEELGNDRDGDLGGTVSSTQDNRDVGSNESLEVRDCDANDGDDVLEDRDDHFLGHGLLLQTV